MIQVIMAAMGCDRRAHYGNVEQPFCGKHGHYGQWPCPDAMRITDALTAAGFGLVADAGAKAHQLKSVRGHLKTLGKNLDSWESEGHTTATIRFLRQWIGRADAAVRGEG